MKTITMIVIVLSLVGCTRIRTAEEYAKAEEYCRKYNQPDVVALSALIDPNNRATDFGCRKKGDLSYTLVPESVYSESPSSK